MKNIDATTHAQRRMSQRAISEMQVRLIEEFGNYEYQKGGTHLAFIPEKCLADLRRAIDKLSGITVVLGECDKVVTTFHKNHRTHKTLLTA